MGEDFWIYSNVVVIASSHVNLSNTSETNTLIGCCIDISYGLMLVRLTVLTRQSGA